MEPIIHTERVNYLFPLSDSIGPVPVNGKKHTHAMPTPLANKEHLVMMTSPPASQPKRTSPLRPFGSGPSGNLKPSCTRPWRERRSGRMAVGQSMGLEYTPESTHIDPRRMAPLKECVPLPTDVVFRVHGIVFQGVLIFQADTGEDRHSN